MDSGISGRSSAPPSAASGTPMSAQPNRMQLTPLSLLEHAAAVFGDRLAIVAGGRIVAAPTIREPLTEGEAYVSVAQDDVERVFDALSE